MSSDVRPDGGESHFDRFARQKFFHNLDWLRGNISFMWF